MLAVAIVERLIQGSLGRVSNAEIPVLPRVLLDDRSARQPERVDHDRGRGDAERNMIGFDLMVPHEICERGEVLRLARSKELESAFGVDADESRSVIDLSRTFGRLTLHVRRLDRRVSGAIRAPDVGAPTA